MDQSKCSAAKEALKFVRKGMSVGLGTGSTAEIFIDLLGKKNRAESLRLTCIATSVASERQARRLGLKLAGFEKIRKLDIAFDGADQVDKSLCLIKGLGGALVREKIVDYRAKKFVVLVGENKLVPRLSGVVPVEAIPLAEDAVARDLLSLGASRVGIRMEGSAPFRTDNGNIILHAVFGSIKDPARLEERINNIAGVVDNGIFSGKRPVVIVGGEGGLARAIR
ncbi:Ribose-5-phosphate isomerase A [uncultured archaeon]|nr:Ribose-5-phosphate isomerase A [uncultured archaeon]